MCTGLLSFSFRALLSVLCVFYVPSDGCSHLSEVVVVDLEAYLFFIVLSFLVKSIFWTSRHE